MSKDVMAIHIVIRECQNNALIVEEHRVGRDVLPRVTDVGKAGAELD